MIEGKNLMPYMGVANEFAIDVKKSNGQVRHFKAFTYQAYNAYGLIGPENNGIAIVDQDKMRVVTDGICPIESGYFGTSPEQAAEAKKLAGMDQKEFVAFVNATKNLRIADWL